MASSGNFSTNKYSTSSQGTIGLNLSWSITSQNIANNTSTIKWTLKSNGTLSSSSWVMGGPISAYINGTRVFYQSGRFHVNGSGGYKKSGTITVTHNTDGSKTVAMSISAALYSTSQNCKASKSYTLDKIDRYALLNTVEDLSDDYSVFPTITYTNALTTQVSGIKVRLTWNNGANYTAWSSELPNDPTAEGFGTYTFTNDILTDSIRDTLLGLIPTQTSLAIGYEMVSTLTVGETPTDYTSTKTAQLVVNEETAKPTWSGTPISYQDINPSVVAISGSTAQNPIIVRNQSTLEVTIGQATANKGATIGGFTSSSYRFSINGVLTALDSSGKATVVKPSSSGVYYLRIDITDSRGFTNTETVDFVIVDWSLPTADCSLARKANYYTESDLTVKYSVSSVGTNAVRVWENHKEAGENSSWVYNTPKNITTDITTSPTNTYVFPETSADPDDLLTNNKGWVVRVFVGDSFTTGTIDENNTTLRYYDMSVDRGVPLFFVDVLKHSLSMNALPTKANQFYIVGDIVVNPEESEEIKLPHRYSTTEQVIGYWIDGRPIYELTVELSTAVTISANAWNNSVYTHSEDIIIIEVEAKQYDATTGIFANWGFMASQSTPSDKKVIGLYNSRNADCQVNLLVLKYVKPLPTP